jgi:DNA (cytosine-5)-methyltransferase 1
VPIKVLDLFCGAGGSSCGARSAGTTIVCGIDAWPLATETFKFNFPNAVALNTTLDERSGTKILGGIGDIDLILASPECTNHTCAKGGRPRDEESRLSARYVLAFAQELRPRWIVLENVIQMRWWHGYHRLIEELRSLGYHVRPQVLDAADFGVPQTRRRLFLLCDREVIPQPLRSRATSCRTAGEVLDPPGRWWSGPLYTERRALPTLERADRAIRALGRGVPFLVVYYGSDGAGGWQSLDRPLRTLTTLDRFGLVTWDRGTAMLRMLQVPELKRAMGFDDRFQVECGTRRERIRLLGNGVCPPVMEAVVRSLTGQTKFYSKPLREHSPVHRETSPIHPLAPERDNLKTLTLPLD